MTRDKLPGLSGVDDRTAHRQQVEATAQSVRVPWRFSELMRSLSEISQKTLTDNLRALENDGLIARTVYPETLPHIEYALSELNVTIHHIVETVQE